MYVCMYVYVLFTTCAAVLYWVSKLEPKTRSRIVYPVKHSRECCK